MAAQRSMEGRKKEWWDERSQEHRDQLSPFILLALAAIVPRTKWDLHKDLWCCP